MANASYAPVGSGPLAGAIGWVNFSTTALNPNTATIVNGTLRDGSTILFNLTNTDVSGNRSYIGTNAPTFGAAPFGNAGGYQGVTGSVIMYSLGGAAYRSILSFSDIVVKDHLGITIPDYTIVTADGEATSTGENLIFNTDGGVWDQIGNIGAGNSPSFVGLGTPTVTATGISTNYHSLILTTTSPKNIDITLFGTGGLEGVAFGVILTKAQVNKVINNRVYSNDQFDLSITGATISSTTITTGNSNGTQLQSPYLYVTLDSISSSSFIINESMAPGSIGTLGTNYKTTVQNANFTPGGSTVPSSGTLGETITAKLGDWMVTTITNTAITSTLTATKIVDKVKTLPGDILTYTIELNNQGPLTISNTVFKDTIPTGSSFIANSITINGVSVPGSVAPPSGVNIGTLPIGVTTLTFQVALQTTQVVNNTVKNNATAIGYNNLIPINVTIPTNSNTVTTTILGAVSLTSTKISKPYANIGDVLTYTIPITNIGNTTAINILFIDTIPNGTTFVTNSLRQDATAVSGSPNPPGITLSNPIGRSSTSTLTFQVRVITLPSPNPIPNSATQIFQYTIDNSTVPNVVGNGSSNTNIANTFINRADLSSIIKVVNKDFAIIGDELTYTISIPNTGTTNANSVIFIDTIPTGTIYVPNSFTVNGVVKSGVSPQPPGVNIGTIPSGETFKVTFKVTVNTIPSPNNVLNSATTTFIYQVDPSVVTSTTGSANSNIVNTTIARTAIILPTKSVNVPGGFIGNTITYTIGFRNTGTTTAHNIFFTDTTPNGTTFVNDSIQIDGTTITSATLNPPSGVTIPDLGVNQSTTLTFQVVVNTIPSPNPITNIGTTSYRYTDTASGTSGGGINNTNTVSTYIYPNSNPFKTVDKQYATVGDTLTYTLGWLEVLGVDQTDVIFVDTIPDGTTFVPNSVTVNSMLIPGATVTAPNGINTGTLSAGQMVSVNFKVIVNTIPTINPIPNDTTLIYSTTLTPVKQSDVSNIVTTQINYSNLTGLIKSVDKDFTTVGDTLTYTVTLENTGNSTMENLVFFDTIPNATTFINNSFVLNGVTLPGENPDQPLGASIGTIPIGGIATISFKVIVNTIPSPNSIPNTASLIGNYIVNPITGTTISAGGNTNTVFSKVYFADLSNVIKGVDKAFSDVPTTLTYTITIVNSGNTTADNVVFVDTIPTGTFFVLNSVFVNGVQKGGANPSPPSGFTIGTIPAASTFTVTFEVYVNSIPTTNPIPNTGTVGYNFVVDPTLLTTSSGVHNTNTAYTTINHATLGNILKFT
ncbi:beta strand repeat-containing protein, partial [Romboutsia sp.]|uniref:beta strand repeat-containing protein n=1 Tax=Romboutsia sp. TaxID=1965302 RepID=UPI003F2C8B52